MFNFWNVTCDYFAFFGFAALLGIIMYYWSKAVVEVRNRQLAKMFAALQVHDIE